MSENMEHFESSSGVPVPVELKHGMTRGTFVRGAAMLGALAGGAGLLSACGGGSSASTGASASGSTSSFPGGSDWDAAVRSMVGERTVKIGFTPPAGEEFFTEIEHGAFAQMDEYKRRFGLNFTWDTYIPTGHGSTEKQIAAVQAWAEKGLDAVMICTGGDFASMQRVYSDAAASGTSIYQFNMPAELYSTEEIKAVSTIGYNNAMQAGYLAAQYLIKVLNNSGRVYLVWGAPSDWAKSRLAGFELGVKGSGLEVAGMQRGNYVRDQGMTAALNLLRRDKNVDAIYAENEEMGLGSAQAASQLNLKTWNGESGLVILGANGNKSAYEEIKSGRLTATINVNPVEQGRQSIIAMVMHDVLGYTVDTIINCPTKAIDKSNVDEPLAYWDWAAGYGISS